MQVDTFGDGRDLVWVMGWGNTAEGRHERWLIDRFVDAGYRVHAIELPTNTDDFQRDCVAPVAAYRDDLGEHAAVAHSMGGLALAHCEPDDPAVYLSPWWGMHDLPIVLEPILQLPISRPFLPISVDVDDIGDLATAEDADGPTWISPRWVQTIRRVQHDLPALDPADRVFYAPDDEVVDPDAIVAHTTTEQRTTYEGGHELFSSTGRDTYVEWVLDALPDPT